MKLLKDRILKDGKVIGDSIIKVDSFLNHQLDIELFNEMGREFKARFSDVKINKILTVEASGIAIACITAQYFKVPVVFAKKHDALNIDPDTFRSEVYSFTKQKSYEIRVSKKYIRPEDSVLIIDDFLANGRAASGLADIVRQAGAEVAGVGVVIEKGFQKGREVLQQKGIRIEALAIIKSIENGNITFE
ncbi:MAG: xanthine phosphoribosyltransferase [Clostridiaceae bacterium]|jgi:xanthine phosphoribosyltransferase|nr:xanthine phosphoribosyltransferase [Clostridiaceae bacterium]